MGLTLWDSQGLEKNVVDLQLREITSFLESKFEDTFAEEMKVIRSPGVRDTHIHCVFLILDPVRLDANIAAAEKIANGNANKSDPTRVIGGLDEDLDIQVLRTIMGKTTVVPIISKADTITTAHMAYLKKTVSDSLKKARIDPLEILSLEDQDDETTSTSSLENFDEREEDEMLKEAEEAEEQERTEEVEKEDGNGAEESASTQSEELKPSSPPRTVSHARQKSMSSLSTASVNSDNPIIPLSILSPDPHSLANKDEPVGRRFPWGFADPHNPEHCDFLKLKESVFGEWRAELREASREVWYERWRTSRLNYNNTRLPLRNGARESTSRSGVVTR